MEDLDRSHDPSPPLIRGGRAMRTQRLVVFLGHGILFAITTVSVFAVFFIFYFITRDALPFFRQEGIREFFTSRMWYPTSNPPQFGTLAIFVGSALVTVGAILVAVPLGLAAAVCMSDILPFGLRQIIKPLIEILAAIPSVAYGFFALVVFAPLLQERGGQLLALGILLIGTPLAALLAFVVGNSLSHRIRVGPCRLVRWGLPAAFTGVFLAGVMLVAKRVSLVPVDSGTNALNVSIILGIMALPTIVSVSEDALQAVGRELREGSYALGATRAETILRCVLPAAGSGIGAAVILGVMRAVGETMVVWMASGNAAQIPTPPWNFLQPVRTLTATIAGDMGEADHVTGSSRYHVLWAMALCLLVFSFVCNVLSEAIGRRTRRMMRG